jgi:hypothetical protein
MQDTPPERLPTKNTRARLWRLRRAVLSTAGVLVLLPLVVAAALVWVLSQAPQRLPGAVEARIEARLDAAMQANGLRLGAVDLSLEAGLTRPDLTFSDVVLTDPDGQRRASLPSVSVRLDGQALLRGGEVRPLRVEVAGAALILRRDATGRIDLVLSEEEAAAEVSLAESLARLDAMFAAPEFAGLDVVEGNGLSVSMADNMTGQIMRLSEARMRLIRRPEGLTLTLVGGLAGSRDATLDIALNRGAEAGRTTVGFAFDNLAARDLATAAPALGWLDLMRAPISGFIGGQLSDDGSLGDIRASLEIGPGRVQIDGTSAPLRVDAIAADLRFDSARRRLMFDRFDLDAATLRFAAEGHADVAPDGQVFTGQFTFSRIALSAADLPAPLGFEGGALDLRLTLGSTLGLEIGQASLHGGDLGSAHLRGQGRIAARPEGLDLALDLDLDAAEARDLLALWPPGLAERSRRWMDENLLAARLRGVDFSLRQAAGDVPETYLDLDFDDLRLRAMRQMPPIEDGAGYMRIAGDRLHLRLDRGQMMAPGGGSVSLAGSRMRVADIRQRPAVAEHDLQLAGALEPVLRLLQAPPVRLFDDGAMTVARVGSGQVNAQAQITAAMIERAPGAPLDDVRFAVAAEITEYRAADLVPGRLLTADRLGVAVTPDSIEITGTAEIDGVPMTGRWSRALGRDADSTARIEARAPLTGDGLAVLGVPLPPWLLSGETEADLELRLTPGTPADLRLRSDLDGVRLSIPQLAWGKSAAQDGQLEVEMTLGPAPQVRRLSLQTAGLDMVGRVVPGSGPGTARLEAERFALGRWLDVRGSLTGRGQGRAPAVQITGGTIDLRGAPQGGGIGAGGGGQAPVTVALDRLQVSEGIALTDLRADLTAGAGFSGDFRGRINGSAEIAGNLVRTETGQAVRVRSPDGGAVLRAAGIFRSAYGGEMELLLNATGQQGSYDGVLSIDGPRLRDAPAMAELLNLISVVGLLEQLGGEGINLGEIDARFRLTPSRLLLQEGTAVGPSMGLSLDGQYDLETGQLEMQGVVSPLYLVNGLVGAIFSPRREGLFGFAYRLTGTAENTQVTVNPLSILTPGIFREIFRRPPPALTETQ